MDKVLELIVDFFISFVLVLIAYFLYIYIQNRRSNNNGKFFKKSLRKQEKMLKREIKRQKKKEENKKRDEVGFFVKRYNIDLNVISYKSIERSIVIINSFIIAFAATLLTHFENFWLGLLIAFAIMMILIYSLYEITGKLYKRKEKKKNV